MGYGVEDWNKLNSGKDDEIFNKQAFIEEEIKQLKTENAIYFQERNESWKQNAVLEAERTELRNKVIEEAIQELEDHHSKVGTGDDYSCGVANCINLLNSLKTK